MYHFYTQELPLQMANQIISLAEAAIQSTSLWIHFKGSSLDHSCIASKIFSNLASAMMCDTGLDPYMHTILYLVVLIGRPLV